MVAFMKKFEQKFIDIDSVISMDNEPDFDNLLDVLKLKAPKRSVIFEFAINEGIIDLATKGLKYDENDPLLLNKKLADGFRILGYDHVCVWPTAFDFASNRNQHKKQSISINEGAVIHDRESFLAYQWNNPDDYSDYDEILGMLTGYISGKQKVIVTGPGGVLEVVIMLVGYENLCLMIYDDPKLVHAIFKEVADRFCRHYEICGQYDIVGGMFSNDDWGFNTQTLMSTEDMRKYVFPWHKKIVAAAHKKNKPAILHSCGNAALIYGDIIDGIGYDGKHSYEDNIQSVEDAYEMLKGRIAVLGGMDLDFVTRKTPEEITQRAKAMLERASECGGYALGTGNSVPASVPFENYLAMIKAVLG